MKANVALVEGERLLWEGRSSGGIRFGLIDVPITLFMLFWTSVPLSMTWTSLREGRGELLFGLPFLLIGFYMLVGRFLVDRWLRDHSRYVLTSHRAIILKNEGRSGIRSVNLSAVGEVRLSRSFGNRGTITFSENSGWWMAWNQPSLAGMIQYQPAFILIDDADHVFSLAQRAVAKS